LTLNEVAIASCEARPASSRRVESDGLVQRRGRAVRPDHDVLVPVVGLVDELVELDQPGELLRLVGAAAA
jgi:hypothetical protein